MFCHCSQLVGLCASGLTSLTSISFYALSQLLLRLFVKYYNHQLDGYNKKLIFCCCSQDNDYAKIIFEFNLNPIFLHTRVVRREQFQQYRGSNFFFALLILSIRRTRSDKKVKCRMLWKSFCKSS